MTIRAGFIGLGNQGGPMAVNLVRAGFAPYVFDIAPGPVAALVTTGARAAASPREVAEHADVIGICVPADQHVRTVFSGADGLLAGARPGTIVAIHSTILPETAITLGEAAARQGVVVLDACVTGGAARAEERQLTVLVGGDSAALERARPVFEASAARIISAGALGDGAKLKLCLNLLTYIQWAAAYESFALARAVGLPPEILEEAGQANGQLTPLMLAYVALHRMPEEARHSGPMQASLRGFMHLAEKDLACALDLARAAGVALPVGGLVSQLMARLYAVDDPDRR